MAHFLADMAGTALVALVGLVLAVVIATPLRMRQVLGYLAGASQKIGNEETAYSYREANYVHVIAAMYPDPADTPKNKQWVRNYWEALRPHSAGGAYLNFLTEDDGEDRLKACFRGNYDRLVSIKNKYDPGNLFRVNQNIKPTK